MKLAISTDHAGFMDSQKLIEFLSSKGHQCFNFGPITYQENDDYPDFIFPAAKAVADGSCERGIIMGGSGEGEAMAANRTKGIRCSVYYGPAKAIQAIDAEGHIDNDSYEIIKLSREHNDANMLSIAARFVDYSEIEKIIDLWLSIPFGADERHQRRNQKLDEESI